MLVYGFVRDHKEEGKQALVVEQNKCSERKFYKLLDDGFVLVLDNNFSTVKEAYEYLESGYVDENSSEQHAYEYCCLICKNWSESVGFATGSRWSFKQERYVVFNGYVCEQCANDNFKTITWKH